jgi:hypothetical protein
VRLTPPALTRRDLAAGVDPVNGGCLLCGIGAVEVTSQQVSRAGGVAVATMDAWTLRAACDLTQLGGRKRGLTRLRGYTCPTCSEAVEWAGSVGPSAIERSLVVTLGLGLHWTGDRTLTRTPAWGALVAGAQRIGLPTLIPNDQPWQHLGDLSALRDRLAAGLLGVAQ